MKDIKEQWTKQILACLSSRATEPGVDTDKFRNMLSVGKPPKSDMGDLAFPMFPFAGILKTSPVKLAAEIADTLTVSGAKIKAAGPYVNVWIDRQAAMDSILSEIHKADFWGSGNELAGRKIMIEFSSPNTNKPLHLGHLRNDILGESCARILAARGAELKKVCLVNDRGIHICKSMLAYRKFRDGQTPDGKSDSFVGDLYVQYNQWAETDSSAEKQAQELLQEWESGNPEVRQLWKTMNAWALDGINATYARTGISFDIIYRESETYLLGKEQVIKGLEKNVFFKADDGSLRLDMSEIGLDTKVFLRSDGTSVYITQDLGTAIRRHEEWPFDQLIYVVGNEQDYHFKALFYALKKLGMPWAPLLRHLSYGMVNLPEGKMKSREGTVVDADTLLDNLTSLALEEIESKGRLEAVGNPEETAEKIALAALHYFLLQVSPARDMLFNPQESLSFTGNTGPYLQYMAARVIGLISKAASHTDNCTMDTTLLIRDDEWQLTRKLGEFPELVSRSADRLDPSILANGLYEIARDFSHYYHEVPIARADSPKLAKTRMTLAESVLITLKSGFYLLNIPWVESM